MVRKDRDRSIIGKVFQSFTSIRQHSRMIVSLSSSEGTSYFIGEGFRHSYGWYFYRNSLGDKAMQYSIPPQHLLSLILILQTRVH